MTDVGPRKSREVVPVRASDRLSCAHCGQTGTCTNGLEGRSCAACARGTGLLRPFLGNRFPQDSSGIVCSVCDGVGSVEPYSVRLNKRIVPLLAILIVYFALAIVLFFATKDKFDQILAFAATLIGSITGYYFGGKRGGSD